jgi:acylphosphatase
MAQAQPRKAAGDWVRAHVWISGKVQGVGYRFSTCDTATLLKVYGWVRNLRDGRVEAVFEGPGDRVQEMIRWCHQAIGWRATQQVAGMFAIPTNRALKPRTPTAHRNRAPDRKYAGDQRMGNLDSTLTQP